MHTGGNPEEISLNSFDVVLVPTTSPPFIPRGEMVQQQGSKNLNQSCDRNQQLFHAHSPHPTKDQGLFLHLKNISLTNYIHSTCNIFGFANE